MFLRTQGFKKLINEAYKGRGLRIERDIEGYTMAGGYWMIWIAKDRIPKKELAAIIELTGELPGIGEGFEATKAGNQYELQWGEEHNAMKMANECEDQIEVTPVTLKYASGVQARILQDPANRSIILVNEKFIEMIDNAVVEYENGEMQAQGPLIGRKTGVYWKNDIMALRVMPRTDDQNAALLGYLEQFNIIKGGNTEDEH